MIQGSNMTRSHKGMRKGMSLLELLTAIVLLGILSGVGFKYYKIFYDTSFAAKQAKMYIMIEQGQQLLGAHSLFDTKNGISPINIESMVIDKQLKEVPPAIPEISNSGWKLWTYQSTDLYATGNGADANISLNTTENAATGSNGGIDNDIAFILPLDGNGTSDADKLDYCNIINNTGQRTWRLDTNISIYQSIAGGTTLGDGEAFDWYTLAISADNNVSTELFCFMDDGSASDGNLTVVFKVLVDLL